MKLEIKYLLAPLPTSISPKWLAILCIAVGATQMGEEILVPKIVVSVSICSTFLSILGMIKNL